MRLGDMKNYLIALLLSITFAAPAFAQYSPGNHFSLTPRRAIADAAVTQTASDCVIAFTSLSATRAVTLTTTGMAIGQPIIIKDESGTAGTNNITTTGVTIDGANPSITTNYGVLRLYFNGTTYNTW
jgi:hypothetical protein